MTTHDAALRLIEVLRRENAALLTTDLAGSVALVPEKQAAIEALARAGEPATLDRATAETLRDLARENQALVKRALAIQGRVIALIAGAAADTPDAPRYGAAGTMAISRSVPPRALLARA